MNDHVPTVDLGLDHHGAAFPTTATLVSAVQELRKEHSDARHGVVLLSASISNAAEIVDLLGSAALEVVTSEVARRTLQHEHLPARLLRASSLGGFLVAVVVERDLARAQVADLMSEVRGLVSAADDQVWPIITVGARLYEEHDDTWSAIRDVRTAVFAAGRHTAGSVLWYEDADERDRPLDLPVIRDLALALEHDPDQFQLHYQPVRDLRNPRLLGAEALLRWEHPELGRISPDRAVEAAERSGLIVPLGRHVLRAALRQTAQWLPQLEEEYRVHVNVSPLELRHAEYADHLEEALLRSGVPAHRVLLEVTETALVSDDISVHHSLARIAELGVCLGVDDFGTGYSSIANLRRMPIDTIKIDRSLVTGIGTSAADFTLARSVLQLVSSMGVMIVAEGIESAVEAAHLRAMGCQVGQGYHLGRPVPAVDFMPAQEHHKRTHTA